MNGWTLKRVATSSWGTFGVLLTCNVPKFVTLEPVVPIVWPGVYMLNKIISPKRKYHIFQFENVPGHSAVQIHAGNVLKDTSGCILIGLCFGMLSQGPAILSSRHALNEFINMNGKKVRLLIE